MPNPGPAGSTRTVPRRLLAAVFPGRPPPAWLRPAALSATRRLASFAEWVQANAETAALALEDLDL